MWYPLYNLVFTLALLLTFPYLFLKALIGRYGIKERFGLVSSKKIESLNKNLPIIWIQAASVGEVKAIATLIKDLKNQVHNLQIVVSTTSKTGKMQALKFVSEISFHTYLPLDLPFFVKKGLKKISPNILILVETEIWPNLIKYAKQQNTKILLVNGRISQRSYPRYLKIKNFTKQIFLNFDRCAMQSEKDARRIQNLGMPEEKIFVAGNLKLDSIFSSPQESTLESLREKYQLPSNLRFWVAGSTREKEEEIILETFRRLKQKFPDLVLILAPRHMKRISALELLLSEKNFKFLLKTRLNGKIKEEEFPEVLLLDTMGELAEFYGVCEIAFVGGSFTPRGGHNVWEPLRFKVPVFFGPHMDISDNHLKFLLKEDLVFKVENPAELYSRTLEVLDNPERKIKIKQGIEQIFQRKLEATRKTLELILTELKK